MRICLDIDDTITYAPELFRLLTAAQDGEIIIVSFRTDRDDAVRTLEAHSIRWNRLILSNDSEFGKRDDQSLTEWKAWIVNQLAPAWFFEDMPEVACRIDSNIKVFMPCDDVIRDWLSKATGSQ